VIALATESIRRWRQSEVEIRPGASGTQVSQFEKRYGVVLPRDLRAFLRVVNGMHPNDMDPVEHFRFWPIEEIKPVTEEFPDNKALASLGDLFLFADYSLWAHGYGIRLFSDAGLANEVMLVGGEYPRVIGSSFEDFLRRYLYEPSTLF